MNQNSTSASEGHTTTACLAGDNIRIAFAASDNLLDAKGVTYSIEVEDQGEWRAVHHSPFVQHWLALRVDQASPVTLASGWFPGEEETNFAAFHTDRSDGGHDVFAAGERIDLLLRNLEQSALNKVTCRTADDVLEVSWQLGTKGRIEVAYTFHPPESGYWSVGFQAFAGMENEAVDALFAGPFLTERRFPILAGVLPEGWVSAPFALLETQVDRAPVTWGLCVHPDEGGWHWDDVSQSRYAIGARNEHGQIQPHIFAPVLGNSGSWREQGDAMHFRMVLHAQRGSWWNAYRTIVRDVYGLRSYRENIYGSLTDAVHNMAALLKDETFSGWMERGRGLLNIEHRGGVKLASPAAVLSVGLATGDDELLESRAQPILEYSISRSHYGFTWEIGSETVGQEHVRQAFEDLGGPAWDAPVLVALHQLSRGYTPALASLALEQGHGIEDFYIRRSDFQVSLAMYHLTADRAWLDRACEQADTYISKRIDEPATDLVEGQRFLIHIGSDWMSLLDLWEASGEKRFLDAAQKGARWFATMLWVGPVPDEQCANAPTPTISREEAERRLNAFYQHMYTGHSSSSSWIRDAVPYPRGKDDIVQETVPAWVTSPVGMSFEAWCTYRGRMVQNPGWAAYLLRVAQATGDGLFRDLAENSIVGRFTNYPGYYYYMPTVAPLKPDFPYLGPMDLTSIYYHHLPPQIGLAFDFLIEQAKDRSEGRISFPVVRDDSYVQFRHHLPGHSPGRFFDIDDAWIWMPESVVELDSHLVNWISVANGDGTRFGAALSNSSRRPIEVTLRFHRELLGLGQDDTPHLTARDASGSVMWESTLEDADTTIVVPPMGLVALLIDDVRITEPLHDYREARLVPESSFITLADDHPHLGTVRVAIVAVGPGNPAVYAFTTLKPENIACFTMTYEQQGESHEVVCDRFPFEVSVPLVRSPFRLRLAVVDHQGRRHETEMASLTFSGKQS
jgi:hypothetical protein